MSECGRVLYPVDPSVSKLAEIQTFSSKIVIVSINFEAFRIITIIVNVQIVIELIVVQSLTVFPPKPIFYLAWSIEGFFNKKATIQWVFFLTR